VGRGVDLGSGGLTNRALEAAPAVLLVGFEAEEEAPGVFLRLRKAMRTRGQRTFSIASHATNGLRKAGGTLLPAAPGTETDWLKALTDRTGLDESGEAAAEALRAEGSVIVVGERLASVPGALTAAVGTSAATGARLVWIPRRAGERGAIEAGALPTLLPGGRPVDDARARDEVARVWGLAELPADQGRDTAGIIDAVVDGEIDALVVGGVELADLPDPARAARALERAGFVVSLELRPSEVTDRADVVLPVSAVVEKAGTFLNWEGRARPFEASLKADQMTRRHVQPDARVLHMLADALDVHLGLPDVRTIRSEIDRLGQWEADGSAGSPPASGGSAPTAADSSTDTASSRPKAAKGEAVLAGHRLLLDQGRLQDGDEALAATRHAPVARLSRATAAEAGVADGDVVSVSGPDGSVQLPLQITQMPDRVVWVPLNSLGDGVQSDTGALPGEVVRIAAAATQGAAT
jgi:NADH-quinone oxidoreductase subunit G